MRSLSMAVFAALCAAQVASAQPRPQAPAPGGSGSEEIRKIEAELEKLRAQAKELESRLSKARDGNAARDGDRRGPGPMGPMGGAPGFGQRPMGPGFGPMGPPGFGFGPGGGPMGRPGFTPPMMERGAFPGRPGGAGPSGNPPDITRRLERIIGELEQIKREVDRQRGPNPGTGPGGGSRGPGLGTGSSSGGSRGPDR